MKIRHSLQTLLQYYYYLLRIVFYRRNIIFSVLSVFIPKKAKTYRCLFNFINIFISQRLCLSYDTRAIAEVAFTKPVVVCPETPFPGTTFHGDSVTDIRMMRLKQRNEMWSKLIKIFLYFSAFMLYVVVL